MIKKLSKELCELCGISPTKITNTAFLTIKELDFAKPENFINLLTIIHNEDLIIDNSNYSDESDFITEFLKEWIAYLKNSKYAEQLKEKIKNSNWSY